MRKVTVVVLMLVLATLPFTSACDQLPDIDPVETLCGICQILDESGLCSMVQSEAAECAEGERYVLLNLEEIASAISSGQAPPAPEAGCR